MAANIADGKYYIKNVVTNRFALSLGTIIDPDNRGAEGGYLYAPNIVGTDRDRQNRATWRIIHQFDEKYFIENVKNFRYLFQDGKPLSKNPDDVGSWENAPNALGSDQNYYYRAYWRFILQADGSYLIQNDFTGRYLFQTGPPATGPEGDFEDAPETLGTDDNYENRATWTLELKDV